MEIKTAFGVIVGLLLVSAVILAATLITGSMMNEIIFMEECIPIGYTATSTGLTGVFCGYSPSGATVFCDNIDDACIDDVSNMCCPTSKKGKGEPPNWYVKRVGDICCNVSVV